MECLKSQQGQLNMEKYKVHGHHWGIKRKKKPSKHSDVSKQTGGSR